MVSRGGGVEIPQFFGGVELRLIVLTVLLERVPE